MVKNLPAVWETWVRSLGGEDPLEECMATHSSILAWRIPMDRGAWRATVHGVAKSRTRLSDSAQHNSVRNSQNSFLLKTSKLGKRTIGSKKNYSLSKWVGTIFLPSSWLVIFQLCGSFISRLLVLKHELSQSPRR